VVEPVVQELLVKVTLAHQVALVVTVAVVLVL
jgi:hypothetical protein